MKTVLILCLGLGIATAAVGPHPNDVNEDPILSLESNVEYDGKYHYHFETGSGTKATQDGYLKKITPENDGEAIEGQFSFISNDGNEYAIAYTADENGYQPHGAHIPTPPPTPIAIQRALEYIAAHPYVEPAEKLPVKG